MNEQSFFFYLLLKGEKLCLFCALKDFVISRVWILFLDICSLMMLKEKVFSKIILYLRDLWCLELMSAYRGVVGIFLMGRLLIYFYDIFRRGVWFFQKPQGVVNKWCPNYPGGGGSDPSVWKF